MRQTADLDAEALTSGFSVKLDVYAGPFDVLLGLLANRKLELTEVALSAVTEEFLAYVRTLDLSADMDEASAFLDVASVLVEAKSAALLPRDESAADDEFTMEALRERDLLFARLLQYRAFKQAAGDFRARLAANAGYYAHPGVMDAALASMLPELVWTVGPEDLARIAAHALANAPTQEVSLHQLHVPLVNVREQTALVEQRLRSAARDAVVTFAQLVADARGRLEVVARFLAVLALFKHGVLRLRQEHPYGELQIRWCENERSEGAPDDAAGDVPDSLPEGNTPTAAQSGQKEHNDE